MPGIPLPGDLVYRKFTTRSFTTGVSTTPVGLVVSIYKDDSTTESTTGVTLVSPFDSVAGLNHITINTALDGTFYSSGSTFYLVITTGTVDGVSLVGYTVGEFDLANIPDVNVAKIGGQTVTASGAITANANLGTTQPINFHGTSTSAYVKSDVEEINDQAVTASGGITFPAATLASTTNITAGTITTVSGNVTGSVGSISGVSFPINFSSLSITAGGIAKADLQTILTHAVTCAAGPTIGAYVGNANAAIDTDVNGRVLVRFTGF